jgi:threonine/homoserine/homoserine lactone efflux protein
MFGTQDLPLFVVSALLLNITPGADTLYIVGRSSTQGLKAGAVAALGIGAGIMVHITAAALGVSALFTASATAFAFLKLAGAAYLIYVGISLMRARTDAASASGVPQPASSRTIFVQGFWTNALNPKVAVFFLAFLPQFVDAAAPHKALSLLFLGLLFNLNGTLWNLFVAWSSARIGRALMTRGAAARWFNRSVGALFVFLGARLALDKG